MIHLNKKVELVIKVLDLGSWYDYTELLTANDIKWFCDTSRNSEKSNIYISAGNLAELIRVKTVLQERNIKWDVVL